MDALDYLMPSQLIRPDRGMLQKLKEYDSKLDAFLNVINGRWTIVRYVKVFRYEGEAYGARWYQQIEVPWPVLCVQDWDEGYMPLDERAFYLLIGGDLQKIDNLDKWCNERGQRQMAAREKEQLDLKDDIKHLTLDHKRQLIPALEPFDRGGWGEKAPPPVPMSHTPVEVDLDEFTF